MNNSNLQIHRPVPTKSEITTEYFRQGTDIQSTLEALLQGKYVLVEGVYHNGMVLLYELQNLLKKKYPNQSFLEQRNYRSEYQKLSNHILLEVSEHELLVKKAPFIGWLKKLYPELNDFILSFPQIQGLNSAWQWYERVFLFQA